MRFKIWRRIPSTRAGEMDSTTGPYSQPLSRARYMACAPKFSGENFYVEEFIFMALSFMNNSPPLLHSQYLTQLDCRPRCIVSTTGVGTSFMLLHSIEQFHGGYLSMVRAHVPKASADVYWDELSNWYLYLYYPALCIR